MVQKVWPTRFSGASSIHTARGGLAEVVQGLAIDNARLLLEVSGVKDFTDNSTGTAQAVGLVDVPLPDGRVPNTDGDNVQLTAFNNFLTALHNAHGVLAGTVNAARTLIGFSPILVPGSVVATPETIPAVSKVATAATGTAAVGFSSGRTAINLAKANQRRIARAIGDVVYAVGRAEIPEGYVGQWTYSDTLALSLASASTVGGLTIDKAEMDPIQTALVNNIATLAARWNDAMTQGVGGVGPLHVVASPRQ